MESASELRFEIAGYLPREFTFSIIIALSALTVALLYGAWLGNQIPANEAEGIVESMDEEIEQLTSQTIFMRALHIFINNFGLSLLTLAPFVGWGWMLLITYNTGFILGSFAQTLPGDPIARLLLTLFVIFIFPGLPVALLEFGAYILLFGESIYLSYLALTRSGVRERLTRHSWKTLLIYVAMLFVGAMIESVMMGFQL